MWEWALIPTDYWSFLAGLNGFLLFLLCLSYRHQQQAPPLFIWLGFFAVFQWLQHWLPLLAPAIRAEPPWPRLGLLLTVLSLGSLGIGGVSAIIRTWLRLSLGVGVIGLVLLSLILLGGGRFLPLAPPLLTLGVAASFFGGITLFLEGRRRQADFCRFAGLGLLGYGLGLVLGTAALMPTPDGGVGLNLPWLPLTTPPLVLLVLFGFLVNSLLWLSQQFDATHLPTWLDPPRRFRQALLFLAALILLLGVGGILVGLFGRSLDQDMRRTMATRTRALAAALPLDEIKQLTGTSKDRGTPAYSNLKQLLEKIRLATGDCRFAYLLHFQEKQPVFLVDNEPEDSPALSPPGQVYTEASDQLKAMAACPYSFVEGPITDRWGTWISAFEVIKDPATGAFLAFLGMDIDVWDWQRKIALQKLLPIGIILLVVSILVSFYLSQQQLMVQALQVAHSEERYRSLVESTPNGVCLLDREGRLMAINRHGLEMLKAEASQVIKRPWLALWPDALQARLQEAWLQVMQGQLVQFDVEIPRSGQPLRVWQVVLNPIHDKKQAVQGSVAVLHDITEQKEAEAALRTSQALLQSLLEAIPDLLVVIDRDYRIVYSNAHTSKILKKPLSPTCYQTFHNRLSPCDTCPVRDVFATGQITEREQFNPELQGIFEIRAFPVLDNAGQVSMVIEYIRDITERKRVEEALRSREAKLQSIFRAAPVGIGIVKNRIIQEVNQQICAMTGYTQEELLEQNSRILYPTQEDYDYVGREKYRQLGQKGVGTVETRWRRKDGTIIDILLSSAPLTKDELSGPILFTALDITEQKKLENLRATMDKMESLGIMAGGIAHDFNNVLMAILGNISLLGMASNPQEIREGLREVEEACRQAMLLAKQLLTFAKGGAPLKEVTDIRALLSESARLALSGSKAKVTFAWPHDLWQVKVDAGQMHQVFTNLFINADQAMPGGGEIKVTAANCPIEAESSLPLPPGRYVLIQISDQGIGIPPEHLDKIFDPYFTTKQKGSGLGLTIVYSILKQHGGLITVASELGQGTTFTLYLPALEEDLPGHVEAEPPLYTGQGHILILEDEPAVQTVMAKMLAKLGYEAAFAPDGQEILRLYDQARQQGEPFAAVILDLTIPGGMGGLETCEKLRETDPSVKTVVSSGYADDPVLANYQTYGFNAAIAKPFRLTDLSAVLHQLLADSGTAH